MTADLDDDIDADKDKKYSKNQEELGIGTKK